MPTNPWRSLATAVVALVLAGVCAATASAATVTFKSGFAADGHLGEAATLTSELTFSGTEYAGGVAPLTKLEVSLPAGIGGSAAGFPVCEQVTLEALGPAGCPSGSMAGPQGSVGFEDLIGDDRIKETGVVQPFFAPNEKLLFYMQATAPLSVEIIAQASYGTDTSPYGRLLTLELPLIEALPGAPDVSTTELTLNLGATREADGTTFPFVTVPATCLSNGFPWEAEATFHEATPVTVNYAEPCPEAGSGNPPASGTGSGNGTVPPTGNGTEPPTTSGTVPPPATSGTAPPTNPPPTSAHTLTKPLTTAQRFARDLRQCKRDKPARKRKTCEAQARKRYGVKAKPQGKQRRR